MKMEIVNELIKYLPLHWKTIKGYWIAIVLIIVLFTSIYIQFGEIILLIPFIVSLFIWTITWSLQSGRIILPTKKKTLVLSFLVDDEARKNYKKVIDSLKSIVANLYLDKNVKIIKGSEDLIDNKVEAHKYREKTNVDLIVWGKTEYGNISGKRFTKFNLNHTIAISPSLRNKLDYFKADVSLILLKKKWTIDELDDLNDIYVVADDLFESCLFIIGLFYFDERLFDDSIKIFESLHQIVIRRANKQKNIDIESLAQIGRINAFLADSYFIKALELRQSDRIVETIKYLEKIPKFIPNKIPLYMELARCHYLLDDMSKAEMYTRKISKINKKHPAVSLNNAFFRIKQKKYPSVRFWYDELLKCKDLDEINPGEVISFIEKEYQKDTTEHAFVYGMAILNHFLDETLISSGLEKFLSLTKDKSEYLTLKQKAIELLNQRDIR